MFDLRVIGGKLWLEVAPLRTVGAGAPLTLPGDGEDVADHQI